ncbi:hypothetical protein [Alicyclobacillus dauci]|uniref:YvrJ protein family protein n=1 Tax=Alicyclobacillus dauci TaxID=1475485 RepID=A0ABY6Z6P2_9BACL|nr:hypothetical protein [Alicyclobacillus dauci]WAH38193.1 hypothetical protein NZD86_06830 [Alicyclobacillus dauci]
MTHSWMWPIFLAAGQGITVYGLIFVHRLVRIVSNTLEAHLELLISRDEEKAVHPSKNEV